MSRKRPPKPPDEATRFWRVAAQRLVEAEFLLEHEFTTAPIYLAGYAVECGLKALLLAEMPASRHAELIAEFRGQRGHDIALLRRRYRARATIPREIVLHLVLVETWSTDLRYWPGEADSSEAKQFVAAVRAVLDWAKGRL